MKLNVAMSRRIAKRIDAKNKECFLNAVKGLAFISDLYPAVRYVEGYVVSDFPIVIAHAWLELGGKIIDPTPVYHDRKRAPRSYFPAKQYSFDDVREKIEAAAKDKEADLILPINNLDWLTDPEIRLAHEKASRFVYGDEMYEKILTMRMQGSKE